MKGKVSTWIFFAVIIAIIGVVAGHNFYRYYLQKNYVLHVLTSCDTTTHSCFIADPATADPTFQSAPYDKVEISAAVAPSCLEEHTCTDFACTGIKGYCDLSYCSPATLEDGESCSTTTK
jgi:hypothetical protein